MIISNIMGQPKEKDSMGLIEHAGITTLYMNGEYGTFLTGHGRATEAETSNSTCSLLYSDVSYSRELTVLRSSMHAYNVQTPIC